MKVRESLYIILYAEDGISHIVWVIDNEIIISEIIDLFKEVDYLYIADGHHRSASAVKVGLKEKSRKSKLYW